MVKKVNIIVILGLITYILVSKFFSVDQCDIECDNHIDLLLKEKCYKECYEFNAN